jgi:hypothetical protein
MKICRDDTPVKLEEDGVALATIAPARKDQVDLILAASEDTEDGRSEWLWIRLPNGDLILGVFPQGDTYFATEDRPV